MSNSDDRSKTSIRDRHHPLSWMTEEERAESIAARFTLAQQKAIASDTRLPGEIAHAYKTTAAVIVRIQQKLRQRGDK
jgi:hypothetical protein